MPAATRRPIYNDIMGTPGAARQVAEAPAPGRRASTLTFFTLGIVLGAVLVAVGFGNRGSWGVGR